MKLNDQHELNYWRNASPQLIEEERGRLSIYLRAFGLPKYNGASTAVADVKSILEIGVGPLGGVLPLLPARRKVGIDPLFSAYREIGLFKEQPGIEYVESYFEQWCTEERFEQIVSTNALDHGNLSFQIIPAIARLLAPRGRFYLHVHLRTPELLNAGHDHLMTIESLEEALQQTSLVEIKRNIYEHDIDGQFCRALVAIWEQHD